MNSLKEIKKSLQTLSGIAIKKSFCRFVGIEYLSNLLSSVGSLCGGRYNLKNTFEVLYMAPDLETAIAETKKPHNFKLPPKIIITIDVNVQEIVDLEDTQIVKTLDIDTGQLFGPWRVPINTESYTQTLGRLIYESKNFEGIRYPSAAPSVKNKYNLAIFPDRLKKGSEIRVYDPEKLVEQVILGKE